MLKITKNFYVNIYAFCGLIIAFVMCLGFLSYEKVLADTNYSGYDYTGEHIENISYPDWSIQHTGTRTENLTLLGFQFDVVNYTSESGNIFLKIYQRDSFDGGAEDTSCINTNTNITGDGQYILSLSKTIYAYNHGGDSYNDPSFSLYSDESCNTHIYGGFDISGGADFNPYRYLIFQAVTPPQTTPQINFLGNLDENGAVNSASIYTDTNTSVSTYFELIKDWLWLVLGIIISFMLVKSLLILQNRIMKW